MPPQYPFLGNGLPVLGGCSCKFEPAPTQNHGLRPGPLQILRFKEAAASNFTTASFEGSTHYVLESRWLAGQLRDLFPWLKIGGCWRDGRLLAGAGGGDAGVWRHIRPQDLQLPGPSPADLNLRGQGLGIAVPQKLPGPGRARAGLGTLCAGATCCVCPACRATPPALPCSLSAAPGLSFLCQHCALSTLCLCFADNCNACSGEHAGAHLPGHCHGLSQSGQGPQVRGTGCRQLPSRSRQRSALQGQGVRGSPS